MTKRNDQKRENLDFLIFLNTIKIPANCDKEDFEEVPYLYRLHDEALDEVVVP